LLDTAGSLPEGDTTDLAINVDGGFLPDYPRNLFDAGTFSQVPYILGANSDEGTLFAMGSTPITTEEEYQAELLARFGTNAAAVEALYPASKFGGNYQDALIRVSGDSSLVCSTYDVAKRVADAKVKTYVYNFARVPPLSFITLLNLGAFHGLEIAYVFGTVTPPTSTDAGLGSRMREYWSRFAEKGKPKAAKSVGWPRFKSKSYKMLRLNSTNTKLKDFRRAECDFWTGLYESGAY